MHRLHVFPKLRADQWLSLVLATAMMVFSPSLGLAAAPTRQQIALIDTITLPTRKSTSQAPPIVSAKGIYIADEASGSVLLSSKPNELLYPASTTKIMTALVARDSYSLDTVITIKEEAFAQGNTMGLKPAEKITVESLLTGLLISSGNDAAFALANNHPKGYPGFVAAMNAKAKALGLQSSTFSNPSGLDEPDHQMSAHDLAILSREIFADPVLSAILSTTKATVSNTTQTISHPLTHTHELLFSDETAVGGKTGTTEWAGQVLVTRFVRPDEQGIPRALLVVVMGSQDRYSATKTLIDWTMNSYLWKDVQL